MDYQSSNDLPPNRQPALPDVKIKDIPNLRLPPSNLPPEARTLGDFVAEFPGGAPWHSQHWIVYPLLLLAAGAIPAAISLFRGIDFVGVLLLTGLATFALALLLFGYWQRWRRVLVFKDGILFQLRGQVSTCRWDEVQTLFAAVHQWFAYGVVSSRSDVFALYLQDGRSLRISGPLQHVDELGDILQTEVTRHVLPRCLELLDQGKKVAFGVLELSTSGFTCRGHVLPWQAVQKIVLGNGQLLIRKQGEEMPWAHLMAAQTPNWMVLQLLCQRFFGPLATGEDDYFR